MVIEFSVEYSVDKALISFANIRISRFEISRYFVKCEFF